MKTVTTLGVLLWLTAGCSWAAGKVEYETAPAIKIEYADKRVKYIEATASFDCDKQEATVLDTRVPYFECHSDGHWITFATPELRFAYNHDWVNPPSSWDRGVDSFSLVARKHSPQYGTYYRVVGFTPSRPGTFFVTDFSASFGIIAFYSFDEDAGSSNWFLLTSKKGLGAKGRARK